MSPTPCYVRHRKAEITYIACGHFSLMGNIPSRPPRLSLHESPFRIEKLPWREHHVFVSIRVFRPKTRCTPSARESSGPYGRSHPAWPSFPCISARSRLLALTWFEFHSLTCFFFPFLLMENTSCTRKCRSLIQWLFYRPTSRPVVLPVYSPRCFSSYNRLLGMQFDLSVLD